MSTLALNTADPVEIPSRFAPRAEPGRLGKFFGKVSRFSKSASHAVKTNLKLVREQGLKKTFNKAAPALWSAATGAGVVYGARAGALAAVGLTGVSGLSAVGLGALAAGGAVTGVQYLLDRHRAKKDGKALPSWRDYGLKATFNTISGGFGAGAMNLPESALDTIANFFKSILGIKDSVAASDINLAHFRSADLDPVDVAQEAPAPETGEDTPAPAETVVLSPQARFAALMDTMDTSAWSAAAQDDLRHAMNGRSWAVQNIAHYAANGLLGDGKPDLELALQTALLSKDMGNPMAGTFLSQLQTLGVDVDGTASAHKAEAVSLVPFPAPKPDLAVAGAAVESAEAADLSASSMAKLRMLDETLLSARGQDYYIAALSGDAKALGDLGLHLTSSFVDPKLGLELLQDAAAQDPHSLHAVWIAYYLYNGLDEAGLAADRSAAIAQMQAIEHPAARDWAKRWADEAAKAETVLPAQGSQAFSGAAHSCQVVAEKAGDYIECDAPDRTISPGDVVFLKEKDGQVTELGAGGNLVPQSLRTFFRESVLPWFTARGESGVHVSGNTGPQVAAASPQ
ncbi:MAG: hypothetical protein R3E13_08105 [Alphaproteobacteria bacterium]